MINRNPLFFIILICFALYSFGQNGQSKEELKRLVAEQANDSKKGNTLLDIASQLYGLQPDSSIVYSRKVIALATEINFKNGLASAQKNMGLDYYMKGEFSDTLIHLEKSLVILPKES